MELSVKRKFNGDFNELPTGTLKKHPKSKKLTQEDDFNKQGFKVDAIALVLLVFLYALMCLRIKALAEFINIGTILSLVFLIVHEFCHSLVFYGKVNMYLGMGLIFVRGNEEMNRNRYIFMNLFPNILLGLIPYLIFMSNPSHVILGTFGLFSLVLGIDDYLNVYHALKLPKKAKIFMDKQYTYWYE